MRAPSTPPTVIAALVPGLRHWEGNGDKMGSAAGPVLVRVGDGIMGRWES